MEVGESEVMVVREVEEGMKEKLEPREGMVVREAIVLFGTHLRPNSRLLT